jgi:hypothetical protein
VRERKKERKTSPRDSRDFFERIFVVAASYPVGFHHSRFLFVVQFGFQTVECFQETFERFFRAKLRALFASVAVEERREDEFNRMMIRGETRVVVVIQVATTQMIALKICNAFGRPSRVDGRALDVFALLNLAGFRVPDERVGTRRRRRRRAHVVVV